MEIFISHANADLEIAKSLRLRLDELAPELKCFLLADDVFAGDNWEERIRLAAEVCDAILCVATASYITRPWFAAEWAIFWFQDKPWYLCLLDIDLHEVFEPMRRRQAARLDNRRSVEHLLESVVAHAGFAETAALDLVADEIVKSVAGAVRRRDLAMAEASLAEFALSMQRGTTNVDPLLVRRLLETGKREEVLGIAERSDNSVSLRQLATALLQAGDSEGVTRFVRAIGNLAERRTVGVSALDCLERDPLDDGVRTLLFGIYSDVREPQRRDLRMAAQDRGLELKWPDVEPHP
jgi:TIR domain